MYRLEFDKWLETYNATTSTPIVMGVINITPDSFYHASRHASTTAVLKCAEAMIKDGVDIIDVGAESTRPNSIRVDSITELNRIVPAIEAVKKEFDICLSIDTYKHQVIKAAFDSGADILNDVTALSSDESIKVVKDYNAPVCIMHISGGLEAMNKPFVASSQVIQDIYNFFKVRLQVFKTHGLSDRKIIIDPGIGFGKVTNENLTILRDSAQLQDFNCPILIGVSRKRFIGDVLDKEVERRLYGSLAASVMAYANGCRIFRTHDVAATRDCLAMAHAINKII